MASVELTSPRGVALVIPLSSVDECRLYERRALEMRLLGQYQRAKTARLAYETALVSAFEDLPME